MKTNGDPLETAAKLIRNAEALLIGSGAGMGVDSGLPDFRGPEGFWRAYPRLRKLNLGFEDMANPKWFDTDPRLAWCFYGHRYNLYRRTEPHTGFKILMHWIRALELDHFVYTSNVDEQFQKAGFPKEKIYECHGSLMRFQCFEGCGQKPWIPDPSYEVPIDFKNQVALDPLPSCPECLGIARPNLLMFSDWGWDPASSLKQERNLQRWLMKRDERLVVIEAGAGTSIPTVRIACESATNDSGGMLIRVNPRESESKQPGVSIPLGAQLALQQMDAYLRQF